ncbi:MAG: molecular chaperone HtpG [Planctomycetota bacterium]
MSRKGNISIHTENILPIIKKWMYSDTEIFVRELISNSFDAWTKLRISVASGEYSGEMGEPRIDVKVDTTAKTLTFSDNGIGMTAEEMDKYINQIAFSSAEEFIQKYKNSGKASEKGDGSDVIIGHFGLGFYSSFMVANKVEIVSLSYREGAKAAHWICEGSTEFEITETERAGRGTDVTLHLTSEHLEYLEEDNLKKILHKYCDFLSVPIYLNDSRINTSEALWLKKSQDLEEKDYIEFYHRLHPQNEDPVFWLQLNLEYPFHLKGILYFPKLRYPMETPQGQIRLYSNQVFVSDNCKQILPEFLNMLQGAIDSPDIPLNVSRSYLQNDGQVKQISNHILKKVGDRLNELYKEQPEKYESYWEDIGPFLKVGAIQEEKFYDRVKEIILFKSTSGKHTTVKSYLERNQERPEHQRKIREVPNKIIYYAKPEDEQASSYLSLFKDQNIEVLFVEGILDAHYIQRVETKEERISFSRIDAEVMEHLIDKDREDTLLDAQGRTKASRIQELVKKFLHKDQLEIEAKSLKSDTLPAIIVTQEFGRRFQEMSSVFGKRIQVPLFHKLILNTNHPSVRYLYDLNEKGNTELAEIMAQQMYDLAYLNHHSLSGKELHQFLERSSKLMETLSLKALGKEPSSPTVPPTVPPTV